LISGDTLQKFLRRNFWDLYWNKYGSGGFCSISIPLFSLKYDILIVKFSYSCGPLCGSGGTYIFKKMNNKWIKIYNFHKWIS